jgi:hypothetical protein
MGVVLPVELCGGILSRRGLLLKIAPRFLSHKPIDDT